MPLDLFQDLAAGGRVPSGFRPTVQLSLHRGLATACHVPFDTRRAYALRAVFEGPGYEAGQLVVVHVVVSLVQFLIKSALRAPN